MALKTEGVRTLEFLLSDEESMSYDEVTLTVSASTALKSGTVLGKITASGKYIAYSNGAVDGSQTAVAILRNESQAVNGDYKVAAITRLAEVQGSLLTGIDAPAIVELALVNIIVR